MQIVDITNSNCWYQYVNKCQFRLPYDSVYCMCGVEQSLFDDAVNQWQTRLRACVRTSGGHFKHTLWLSVCFLCTWWTLCFTHCLMQRVIFKECIIKVWNVMFSFTLGSVSTLFRWGGQFSHVCITYFYLLTTVQKFKKNPSRFSRVMVTNVLPVPPFYGSQCIMILNHVGLLA